MSATCARKAAGLQVLRRSCSPAARHQHTWLGTGTGTGQQPGLGIKNALLASSSVLRAPATAHPQADPNKADPLQQMAIDGNTAGARTLFLCWKGAEHCCSSKHTLETLPVSINPAFTPRCRRGMANEGGGL